jgi:hypothetical protein
MKTEELTGAALDWAVAQCEGFSVRNGFDDNCPEYSTNWGQGGPIIEREGISHGKTRNGKSHAAWIGCASDFGMVNFYTGETTLIAAMRCYVASKLGDEVNVPQELMEQ